MKELQKSAEIKNVSRFIKKNNKLNIKADNVEGELYIKSVRIYKTPYSAPTYEVDVEFQGKISFRYVGQRTFNWYGPDCARRSNVKTNRMIRKGIFPDIKNYLKMFDICLYSYRDIKKIVWK